MRKQTKIFVAGSRHISRLSKDAQKRIDNIVEQNFTILVGDANGIDKAVQQYLNDRQYQKVVVFCMEGLCRNNVGEWPTRAIPAPGQTKRDFSYYSTKDKAMVEEANYGLMLWDGESRGTLRSIVDLVHHRKAVVVYVAPERSFFTLSNEKDLEDMLCRYNVYKFSDFDAQLSFETSKSHDRKHARTHPAPYNES